MIRAEQSRSFQLGKVGNRFRDGRPLSELYALRELYEQEAGS